MLMIRGNGAAGRRGEVKVVAKTGWGSEVDKQ